jgi:hypothetical protein
MELTEEQKQAVAGWVQDGAGLAEVQKRLLTEFKLTMTYMDVRFLVLDLDVRLKDPEPEVVEPPATDDDATGQVPSPAADAAPADPASDLPLPPEPMPGGGTVAVDVDVIMRPGSLVSGTVVFGDGTKATWMLDQTGRLALDAGDPTYQPSQSDIAEFQITLQTELAKKGF